MDSERTELIIANIYIAASFLIDELWKSMIMLFVGLVWIIFGLIYFKESQIFRNMRDNIRMIDRELFNKKLDYIIALLPKEKVKRKPGRPKKNENR
jgi:hypothetical protein